MYRTFGVKRTLGKLNGRWFEALEDPKKTQGINWKREAFSRFEGTVCGFGGLGVACWPLVPKFAGSNPAEAVGFLGRKNPQHAFLRRGSKAAGPMS